ncbi:MAG: DNA-binding protein [Desulfobulbaceae bacterium]|jgi:predicted DNA-binding protein with PD1-like motif|nr:DNA-binding protein [Desulfobulbaceae bacterium]MDY0351642.1 DNA-binding protein [Desulfobulbaceae bacterium]
MEYRAGSMGRIFYIRLDDGDDLHQCIRELVVREQVRSAWFQVFGGLKKAGVVTGPREPVMPPDPVWTTVTEAREILGIGSVFRDGEEPLIHLHAAMGRHGDTLTGCVRRDSMVYLVDEVLLMEMTGIDVTRPWSDERGFNRPEFDAPKDQGAAG